MSQLFFSLSVSMGIMITYGSYVKDDVDLLKADNQIELFDTGVAFLAGMMIIPAVYVFLGTDGMCSGPSLTFISLPRVFSAMGGIGRFVGIAFFLALGFAALTSCVSVMETLVANCMEIFHKSRKQMCLAIGVYSLITALLICLGYNLLYFELELPNGSVAQLLDLMDYISNNFLMPFISAADEHTGRLGGRPEVDHCRSGKERRTLWPRASVHRDDPVRRARGDAGALPDLHRPCNLYI